MEFQEAYAAFLQRHRQGRSGECLRRLEEGHGHAERLFLEQVWWPAVGHFDTLVPEYEIQDFRGGVRYLDFAWLRKPYRICLEIDGYGPHVRDISRWQHADHLQRQNDLVMDDWIVLRFAYDDVRERPRRCEQTLQQALGKWFGHTVPSVHLDQEEKKVVQFMISKGEATLASIAEHLQVCTKTARKHLTNLMDKRVIEPASGQKRIRLYRLGGARTGNQIGRYWYLESDKLTP